jgi:hypothetical protein
VLAAISMLTLICVIAFPTAVLSLTWIEDFDRPRSSLDEGKLRGEFLTVSNPRTVLRRCGVTSELRATEVHLNRNHFVGVATNL